MEVEVTNFVYSQVGFWIGNYNSNQFHKFMVLGTETLFTDNFQALTQSSRGLTSFGRRPFVLGLELYNGIFTIYADGDPILTFDDITLYGSDIALVAGSSPGTTPSVTFDTLIIREFR